MKCIAIGFTEMKGKSQKTGNDYHMMNLTILVGNDSASSANFNKLGVGYKTLDLPVEESVKTKFAMLTYPCNLDVALDQRPRGDKLESVAVGLNGEPVLIDVSKQAVPSTAIKSVA